MKRRVKSVQTIEKQISSTKGITLIALVVTIIVLLILATVTISIITGDDGVIDQARDAKRDTEISQWEERIDIAIVNAEGNNEEVTMDIIIQELINRGIISDASKVNTETGDITTNDPSYVISGKLDDYIEKPLEPGDTADKTKKDNYSDGTDTATIPGGFTVSDKEGETTIADGLVVYGPDGSEFVWVPVDIDDMAQCSTAGGTCDLEPQKDGTLKCITHNSTDIVGKLYVSDSGEFSDTAKTTYDPNEEEREPAIVTGNNTGTGTEYDGDSEKLALIEYSSASEMLTGLKNEYKEMATSVAKYGGFYVGRYETSLTSADEEVPGENGSAQSKPGVIPTTAENDATEEWYGLYRISKTYSVTSVTSSMIWGSQYDAIMNWALKGKDAEKVTKTGIGNNSSGRITTTGNSSYADDRVNNIRDLGGNLREWTLEADNTESRVARGGFHDDLYSPLNARSPYWPSERYGTATSRIMLYIK